MIGIAVLHIESSPCCRIGPVLSPVPSPDGGAEARGDGDVVIVAVKEVLTGKIVEQSCLDRPVLVLWAIAVAYTSLSFYFTKQHYIE